MAGFRQVVANSLPLPISEIEPEYERADARENSSRQEKTMVTQRRDEETAAQRHKCEAATCCHLPRAGRYAALFRRNHFHRINHECRIPNRR